MPGSRSPPYTGRHGEAGGTAVGTPVGDRAGGVEARLRLPVRAPAHRPEPWRLSGGGDRPPARARPAAERLRDMLDELGPTFVKFGQLLSTRPDVVPPDIVFELRALQDDVGRSRSREVEQTLEAELGLTLDRAFLEFELEHRSPRPPSGRCTGPCCRTATSVAVKVQRPRAPRQIESDLELLYQAARFVRQRVRALAFRRHRRHRRRVRPLDSRRSSTTGGGAQRGAFPA